MRSKITSFFAAFFAFFVLHANENVFTIIDSSHVYNLNPHTSNFSSDAQMMTGLYEGLFSYNPQTLEPVPAVAESYKVSRDKLRWTFVIRGNAKFSNGEAITAQHVKDSWIALLSPNANAPFASLLDCIQGALEYRMGKGSADDVGIAVQGNNKLSVVLKSPTEHLSSILCHHSFSVVHPNPDVYSGAFVVDSYDENILNLKKNPFYYDAANVKLERIKVIQSDDVAQNAYLYNTGKVDWVVSQIDLNAVLDYSSVLITPEFATEYMFFRCDKSPWDRADFRNALVAAIPWEQLRSQAFVPAQTFIYPTTGYPAPAGMTDTEVELAKLMLTEAKKKAGLPPEKKPEITLAISDTEYMISQSEILRKAWEEIGVSVKISKTPASRYLDSIQGWNADIFCYTWIGDFADPLAFLELFRSASSMNESSWTNDDYDDLLDRASKKTGEERLKLLSLAEDVLLSDGVVIPISHPVTLNVLDLKAVEGWYVNALDIHPLKYLNRKKVELHVPNLVHAKPLQK